MTPSNRDRIVQDLTLSTIADDYENFDHIFTVVKRTARHLGLTIESDQVRDALFCLIETSFGKAYRVSQRHSFDEINGVPSPDDLQGWHYGFLITEQGMRYLQANPVLDAEGEPRGGSGRKVTPPPTPNGGNANDIG